MMGSKERSFAPRIKVSLEHLVPQDHCYRHLERSLDLSFVREFVHETYARGGRPSIDPIVFFKLQLVMFFEGIRSERQLMRYAAERLSIRWFLGYDLGGAWSQLRAYPWCWRQSLRLRSFFPYSIGSCIFPLPAEKNNSRTQREVAVILSHIIAYPCLASGNA
jgi:hypothetical protein